MTTKIKNSKLTKIGSNIFIVFTVFETKKKRYILKFRQIKKISWKYQLLAAEESIILIINEILLSLIWL